MKKVFLRCIAVIMVVLMAAVYVPVAEIDGAFSISASALTSKNNAMENSNAKWSYDTSNKTLTISGSGAIPNYSDTPSAFTKYNAKLVVTIINNAKTIVVENGITAIGNNVFKGFKNVTSVSIASSVTSIATSAFANCTSLSSVSIPDSVTSIGTSAFEGCSSLSSVKLPANLKTIGANAFKNTKFANVKMPDTVTSISSNSFAGVSGLKIVCNYNTDAYNSLVNNSIKFSFPENKFFIDAKLDTVNKQILVNVKMAYNKAELNAGNFTLGFNGAVVPASTETVYVSENGVALATVYHEGKVNFALMAETFVPYSTNSGVSVYDFGTIAFKADGQDATADFSFAADVLMMNNAKTSMNAASASVVLHIYEEKIEKEATCISDGLKTVECSLCGLVKDSIVVAKDPAKHINTEVKNKKDATCAEAGYTGDVVCNDCGAVATAGSEVPATGNHDYEKAVTASTCTETGFTTYTCKVCANSYKGDFTAELGHDFGADGKCSRCDEVTVVSVTFKDNTGFIVNDETKVVMIKKTLNADALRANITSDSWVVTDSKGNALADSDAIRTECLIKAETSDITYTVIVLGDVNGDGKVNSADARILLRAGAKLQELTANAALAADVNNDAKVNSADARVVLRVGAKLQTL